MTCLGVRRRAYVGVTLRWQARREPQVEAASRGRRAIGRNMRYGIVPVSARGPVRRLIRSCRPRSQEQPPEPTAQPPSQRRSRQSRRRSRQSQRRSRTRRLSCRESPDVGLPGGRAADDPSDAAVTAVLYALAAYLATEAIVEVEVGTDMADPNYSLPPLPLPSLPLLPLPPSPL